MDIRIIAAIGRRGQLGLRGGLPWGALFPEDRRRFREKTAGGIVIVGSKTWDSVAHLDGTHGRLFLRDDRQVPIVKTLAALEDAHPGRTVWIAGGAATYERWSGSVTRIDITRLPWDGEADVYLPLLWDDGPPYA